MGRTWTVVLALVLVAGLAMTALRLSGRRRDASAGGALAAGAPADASVPVVPVVSGGAQGARAIAEDVAAREEESSPDVAVRSSAPPDRVALFRATVDARLREEMRSLSDEWTPTRTALRYWTLDHVLGQIESLEASKVARHVDPDDPYAATIAAARPDAPLAELVPWPAEADLDRIWETPGLRALFEEAVLAENRAALCGDDLSAHGSALDAAGRPREGDETLAAWRSLKAQLEAERREAWRRLWKADEAGYPHWEFLAGVAERYFQ